MNLKTSHAVCAAAGDDLLEQMSRANRLAPTDPVGIPATTQENMQQRQQHQQQQQQTTASKVCLLGFLSIFPYHPIWDRVTPNVCVWVYVSGACRIPVCFTQKCKH